LHDAFGHVSFRQVLWPVAVKTISAKCRNIRRHNCVEANCSRSCGM